MSNSQAPIYLAVPASQPNSGIEYLVLAQEGYTVTVSNSICAPLSLHEVLSFTIQDKPSSTVTGVVTALTQTRATVTLTELASVLTATSLSWVPFESTPSLQLKYPNSLLGSLLVYCANTATQLAGYVGWTLYDGSDNILALGNDLDSQNVCQFTATGIWSVGTYKLEVRSFLPVTLQPVKYGSLSWNLTSPAPLLGAGGASDTQGKLILV